MLLSRAPPPLTHRTNYPAHPPHAQYSFLRAQQMSWTVYGARGFALRRAVWFVRVGGRARGGGGRLVVRASVMSQNDSAMLSRSPEFVGDVCAIPRSVVPSCSSVHRGSVGIAQSRALIATPSKVQWVASVRGAVVHT
jgi:hypothetical protein